MRSQDRLRRLITAPPYHLKVMVEYGRQVFLTFKQWYSVGMGESGGRRNVLYTRGRTLHNEPYRRRRRSVGVHAMRSNNMLAWRQRERRSSGSVLNGRSTNPEVANSRPIFVGHLRTNYSHYRRLRQRQSLISTAAAATAAALSISVSKRFV